MNNNALNRLAREQSPYLRQHAGNPVDWHPWGGEAFAVARGRNVPVFLSVGYSTCHWCHVMNRESFSDPETAALMNRHFINIKLDREERPDIDRVYMTFVQATTGGGGWPMSVWLTPDLEPIVGGTYFPPEDAHGRPGFRSVLRRVAGAWAAEEREIRAQAGRVVARLREFADAGAGAAVAGGLTEAPLAGALDQMGRRFDPEHGGFGGAPKFPRPSELIFLLSEACWLGLESKDGRRAAGMAAFTLERMMRGGIHDHLGGGFHRYSVDAQWHIPHYEKMLYDQAQLAEVFLMAHQVTGRDDFAGTARGILAYVLRDMTAPEGGFFSAEDADSLAEGASHKSEGAFYVWRSGEIDRLLGGDAPLFSAAHGVGRDGNAPPGSDPHGELAGTNTLIRRLDDTELAAHFGISPDEAAARLAASGGILFEARAARPRPHLDDKVIAGWNGLMITAFAKAHQVLGGKVWLDAANRAADFLRANLYDEATGALRRLWRGAPSGIGGFAEDHACLIRGLLDLYEAGFDTAHLAWAVALQHRQDELFWDTEHGGYFSSAGSDPSVLLRMKDDHDGAEPSPNSLSALNLLRLSRLLGDPAHTRRAGQTLDALAPQIRHSPLALPMGLTALRQMTEPGRQIILAGERDDPALQDMLRVIRSRFLPGTVVALVSNDADRHFFADKAPIFAGVKAVDGKPTAYVCQNFACNLPVNDTHSLAGLLGPQLLAHFGVD